MERVASESRLTITNHAPRVRRGSFQETKKAPRELTGGAKSVAHFLVTTTSKPSWRKSDTWQKVLRIGKPVAGMTDTTDTTAKPAPGNWGGLFHFRPVSDGGAFSTGDIIECELTQNRAARLPPTPISAPTQLATATVGGFQA